MGRFATVAISWSFMVWFHHKLMHNTNAVMSQRSKIYYLYNRVEIIQQCPAPARPGPSLYLGC